MDELVIEDKKYISSKRAAQITGYAKDYVGQLCREGRVPARLVGRNWYVLESALSDHRFKTPEKAEKAPTNVRDESAVSMSSGWESPHYEAISAKEMPFVKKIEHVENEKEVKKQDPEEAIHFHEAWQAWFDHIAMQSPEGVSKEKEKKGTSTSVIADEVHAEKANKTLVSSDSTDESKPHSVDVSTDVVPIIKHKESREANEEAVLIKTKSEDLSGERSKAASLHRHIQKRPAIKAPIQIVGAVVALVMAFFAVLSTGYFDESIATLTPANLLAGVSMYQNI